MKSLPRISFCLTTKEVDALDAARQRLGRHGVLRNKSEVVRLAIAYLEEMDDDALRAAAGSMMQLKPGRKRTQ